MTNTIKQMGKEVRKDICRLVQKTEEKTKEIGRGLSKLVVYSLAGNLSEKLQKRIRERFYSYGSENCMTRTSRITNMITYPLATYCLTQNSQYAFFAEVYAATEGIARFLDKLEEGEKFESIVVASIPGKLISIPIEYGLNIYERAKQNQKDQKNIEVVEETEHKFKPFRGHGGER